MFGVSPPRCSSAGREPPDIRDPRRWLPDTIVPRRASSRPGAFAHARQGRSPSPPAARERADPRISCCATTPWHGESPSATRPVGLLQRVGATPGYALVPVPPAFADRQARRRRGTHRALSLRTRPPRHKPGFPSTCQFPPPGAHVLLLAPAGRVSFCIVQVQTQYPDTGDGCCAEYPIG